MNALVYVEIDQEILWGKALTISDILFQKYGDFYQFTIIIKV